MALDSIIQKACGFRTLMVVFTLALLCVYLKQPSKSQQSDLDPSNLSLEELKDSFRKVTSSIILHKLLIPPAKPQVQLNLQNPMWESPVTKQVVRLLDGKRNGFFVEAGALDGEYLSNSLELEVKYGWQGLLVEPDSTNLEQLTTKNRQAWIAPICVAEYNFPLTVKMIGARAMRHFRSSSPGNKASETAAINADDECFPLLYLIQALNRTSFDYLSLNVNGAELGVLQTIPFNKISIRIISVEMNNQTGIINFLASKGYRLDGTYDTPTSFARDAIFYREDLVENTQSHMMYKSI